VQSAHAASPASSTMASAIAKTMTTGRAVAKSCQWEPLRSDCSHLPDMFKKALCGIANENQQRIRH
jgi:hypothetical protein